MKRLEEAFKSISVILLIIAGSGVYAARNDAVRDGAVYGV